MTSFAASTICRGCTGVPGDRPCSAMRAGLDLGPTISGAEMVDKYASPSLVYDHSGCSLTPGLLG